MTEDQVTDQMRRYEHASRQLDGWKEVCQDADKLLREHANRKYLGVVTRKVKELCKKNTVSEGRHWWFSGADVHPSVDHSISPWSVKMRASVSVGLYIHEEGVEVCRDKLEIGFDVQEMGVAMDRMDRMMAAGV